MTEINWKSFPRTALYVPEENLTFYTWLEDVEYNNPMPFEILSHYTTFENAEEIMVTGLKAHRVNDHSCITKGGFAKTHPLHFQRFLWVYPDNKITTQVERHGNIRFSNQDLSYFESLNFYITEFIDNCMQPVVRVLATDNKYPNLLKFDITKEKNGPLFFNQENKEWLKFTSFKRKTWSYYEEFDIEIILENCENLFDTISYVKCLNPKSILKNDRYIEKIKAYHCEFGELHFAVFHYKYKDNNKFHINQLDSNTQDSIQSIVTTELTTQWYPLVTSLSCHNNNANELITLLSFDKTLYHRQIQWEDEPLIEDLHFIYATTGEMPDAYVMIKKILDSEEKMRYHRSFREIIELFIDHFKSKDAQMEAQNIITKFIFFH